MKKAIFFFTFFCFTLPQLLGAVSEEPHHTTAFIAPQGHLDLLPTYSNYFTGHFWNKHGKKLPTYNHFRRHSALLYAEYAVTQRNSLSINGGFSEVRETMNNNSRGFEDLELGWKFQILGNQDAALTTQVLGLIPTGKKKSCIRYGQAGVEGSLLYSRRFCFFERRGQVDLALGYRYYSGFPSDQIRANAAFSYQLLPRFRLVGTTSLDYGLFNGDSSKNLNNIVYFPNYRLLKVKFEGVIKIFSCSSLSVGGFQHLWGQNVGAGGGFFCGLWIYF